MVQLINLWMTIFFVWSPCSFANFHRHVLPPLRSCFRGALSCSCISGYFSGCCGFAVNFRSRTAPPSQTDAACCFVYSCASSSSHLSPSPPSPPPAASATPVPDASPFDAFAEVYFSWCCTPFGCLSDSSSNNNSPQMMQAQGREGRQAAQRKEQQIQFLSPFHAQASLPPLDCADIAAPPPSAHLGKHQFDQHQATKSADVGASSSLFSAGSAALALQVPGGDFLQPLSPGSGTITIMLPADVFPFAAAAAAGCQVIISTHSVGHADAATSTAFSPLPTSDPFQPRDEAPSAAPLPPRRALSERPSAPPHPAFASTSGSRAAAAFSPSVESAASFSLVSFSLDTHTTTIDPESNSSLPHLILPHDSTLSLSSRPLPPVPSSSPAEVDAILNDFHPQERTQRQQTSSPPVSQDSKPSPQSISLSNTDLGRNSNSVLSSNNNNPCDNAPAPAAAAAAAAPLPFPSASALSLSLDVVPPVTSCVFPASSSRTLFCADPLPPLEPAAGSTDSPSISLSSTTSRYSFHHHTGPFPVPLTCISGGVRSEIKGASAAVLLLAPPPGSESHHVPVSVPPPVRFTSRCQAVRPADLPRPTPITLTRSVAVTLVPREQATEEDELHQQKQQQQQQPALSSSLPALLVSIPVLSSPTSSSFFSSLSPSAWSSTASSFTFSKSSFAASPHACFSSASCSSSSLSSPSSPSS